MNLRPKRLSSIPFQENWNLKQGVRARRKMVSIGSIINKKQKLRDRTEHKTAVSLHMEWQERLPNLYTI